MKHCASPSRHPQPARHAGEGQHLPVRMEQWSTKAIAHADAVIQRHDTQSLAARNAELVSASTGAQALWNTKAIAQADAVMQRHDARFKSAPPTHCASCWRRPASARAERTMEHESHHTGRFRYAAE